MIRLMIAAMMVVLCACAEQRSPVALGIVNPHLDETGSMQRLSEKLGSRPMTLMDSVIEQGVPAVVATTAFAKYDEFVAQIKNDKFITMIDFTQHSGAKRMYLVDRNSGKVEAMAAAHGEGSDKNNDGYAESFSNVPNSRMSSLGSYLVAERYVGKWGPSMRLDGLESMNSNVRKRAIVLHPASYVRDDQTVQGLSWGCPAVPFTWIDRVIGWLRDGSFMYAYGINGYKETPMDLLTLQLSLQPDYRWVNEGESAPGHGGLTP